jgi:hypothetical protein
LTSRRAATLLAILSAVRYRLSVFLLLAGWFAATQLCALECLGAFAKDTPSAAESGCCAGPGDVCSKDGCNAVENGSPTLVRDLKIAAPQAVACACRICVKFVKAPEPVDESVVRLAFERSDPASPNWQFVQRAALPARAPSSQLA